MQDCVGPTSARPVAVHFNDNLSCSDAAALCLQNLRKTFKYGGRKNVPLREEVQALAVSNLFCFLVCTVELRACCAFFFFFLPFFCLFFFLLMCLFGRSLDTTVHALVNFDVMLRNASEVVKEVY